jgi:glycine/D-amino acid oxidase-like deaminating enzyme
MNERDGATISLWQDTETPAVIHHDNKKTFVYDVAIVGAGITGITTAVLLQKAGMRCIVLEAHHLCYGTTGGTTAHINTVPDTPYNTIIKNFGKNNAILVADALRDAVMLIKENITEHNIDCEMEEVASLLFSQTEEQDEELDKIKEACETVGIAASLVSDYHCYSI